MKKIKKIFIFLLVLIIGSYIWYSFQMNKTYQVPSTELFIEKGLGVKQISADLESTGFIHNDFIFRTYVWVHNLENKFFAGHYNLPEKISMKQLVEILTGNNSFAPSRKVTVIEGWSIPQVASYLEEVMGFEKTEFYRLTGFPISSSENQNGKTVSFDFSSEFAFLRDKPVEFGLEGYLFPDTYNFGLEDDPMTVIRKMLNNFDNKFNQKMRDRAEEQGKTIYEIVTVASILERELRTLDEKKIGADIIYKRLALGMPLQMDSTVNYLTGKKASQVGLQDLEIDSPYNTYKYKGLPPGPISNPGLDSLLAALNPIESDYLYFLTDKEGRAHFSKTYAEHLEKKKRYLD